MTAAATTLARWRGGFIGACSSTLAVGAHGFGGGMPPGGATVVLLLLGSALIGYTAGLRSAARSIPMVTAYLLAGQLVAHLILTFAASHLHSSPVSPAMVGAHVVAALLCAALICLAERFGTAAANRLRTLIRAITVPAETADPVAGISCAGDDFVPRHPYLRSRGNRAPPACHAA